MPHPGQNGRIAYAQKTEGTNQFNIFSAEPDGHAIAQLTDDGKSINPVFSPDGARLAFTSGAKVYIGDQYANDAQLVLDMGGAPGSWTGRRMARGWWARSPTVPTLTASPTSTCSARTAAVSRT